MARVWLDVSSIPPRVIIGEGRGPDKGALRTTKGTDKRSQAQGRTNTHTLLILEVRCHRKA